MNGLHSCKPGNEPVVGQVKTFTVEQRTAASGKAWTKIKSASAENGGQPYKIVSVKPTGHTDSYGNISFNLEIEPSNLSASAQVPDRTDLRSRGDKATFTQDDRSNRIERQHSQEMAIRLLAISEHPAVPDTKKLRELIDWFQRDISRTPLSKIEQQAKAMFNATEADETQPPQETDEEPF